MSNTDAAPIGGTRSRTARAAAAAGATIAETREEQLEAQITQLQGDLKAITATLAKLTSEKVNEAKDTATAEYKHLVRQGKSAINDVADQAETYERQLKDTIREKPLTAVAAAAGIGFIFALLTRH